MVKRKSALGTRVTSLFLASVLSLGLMPASSLAFAAEEIEDAAQAKIAQSESNEQSDESSNDAVSSAKAGDAATDASTETNAGTYNSASTSGDRAHETTSENTTAPNDGSIVNGTANADANTAAGIGNDQPTYTSTDQNRISAMVPIAQTDITIGDVEYNGLTYRINTDGESATLIGLGSTKAAANIAVPSQITTGENLLSVTGIASKMSLGGGAH